MSWSKRESPSSGGLEPVKGIHLDQGLRADIIVDCQVIIEIKAVAKLMPAHDAQRLSYLRMSGLRVGLLFNFPALLLQDGLRRFVI